MNLIKSAEQNDENIYLLLKKGFTASLFVVNPFMPSEQ